MKLILYQATMAITEIDFVPGPFRCQIEQQHLDFAVESKTQNQNLFDLFLQEKLALFRCW